MIDLILNGAIAPTGGEVGLLLGGITALTGSLAYVMRIIFSNHKETKEECREIRGKYDIQQEKLTELSKEVGEMKGRIGVAEEIKPKLDSIEEMVGDLLADIASRNK